jgi:hypothetical protein
MLLAYMENIAEVGMLAAFGTLVAFFADVLISPALMLLATRESRVAALPAQASPVAGGSDGERSDEPRA